jgi:hypothetical protein
MNSDLKKYKTKRDEYVTQWQSTHLAWTGPEIKKQNKDKLVMEWMARRVYNSRQLNGRGKGIRLG